jgi:hypothetical protein
MLQVQELVTSFHKLSLSEQQSVLETLQRAYEERTKLERLAELQLRYPGEWLAVVIPSSEDRYAPEHGYLLAHASERALVWQAIAERAKDKDVFVFYTGASAAKGFEVTFHDTADMPEAAELVK